MESETPEPDPVPDPSALDAPTAELDVVESGARRRRLRRDSKARPPQVRLGTILDGGLAPAIMAIVERGVRRRPALARQLNAEVELNIEGAYPLVRVVFGDRIVLVEDAPGVAPDLKVKATLTDLIHLMVTPLLGGLPSPMDARGRAALGMVMVGRVQIEGRIGLMRRLLGIIRI